MPKEKKKNQCHSDKNPRSYGVVPTKQPQRCCVFTRQAEGEDFFYYVGKDDEVEVLESLGYDLKHSGYLEDDSRVSKYW